MADTDALQRRVARAYEMGRWRMAARALIAIVPLASVCVVISSQKELAVMVTFALGAFVLFLRWRDRTGVLATNLGLQAGTMLVALGIVVCLLPLRVAMGVAGCVALCVMVAATAGLWLGTRPTYRAAADRWLATSTAVLAATLGCLDLGFSLLAGVVFALTVGSVIGGRLAKHA